MHLGIQNAPKIKFPRIEHKLMFNLIWSSDSNIKCKFLCQNV